MTSALNIEEEKENFRGGRIEKFLFWLYDTFDQSNDRYDSHLYIVQGSLQLDELKVFVKSTKIFS